MEIIKTIKEHIYSIVGILAVLVAGILLRDSNTEEVIKDFFRRKQVESEVDKLKEVIAKGNVDVASNDEAILKAAEAMKAAKINVKTASDSEVAEFYKNYFKK